MEDARCSNPCGEEPMGCSNCTSAGDGWIVRSDLREDDLLGWEDYEDELPIEEM